MLASTETGQRAICLYVKPVAERGHRSTSGCNAVAQAVHDRELTEASALRGITVSLAKLEPLDR